MKKLSDVQLFVLRSIFNGGSLIREDSTNELFFGDVDGNDYKIMHPTARKLFLNDLIKIGCSPALGFTSFIVTKKGVSQLQTADLQAIKRHGRSNN